MIGTKLYQRRSRFYFLITLYGVLALVGGVKVTIDAVRGLPLTGAAGFMLIFGAGMCIMTYGKSRKPLVVLKDEVLELNFTRTPEVVRYKGIATASRVDAKRLVIVLKDGQNAKSATVWLKDLEPADADRLESFLTGKGWRRTERKD